MAPQTHSPKAIHSKSKVLFTVCGPDEIPNLPELCSGALPIEHQHLSVPNTRRRIAPYRALHCEKPSLVLEDENFPMSSPGSLYKRLQAEDPSLIPQWVSAEDALQIVAHQKLVPNKDLPEIDKYLKQVYVPTGEGQYLLMGLAPSNLMLGHIRDHFYVKGTFFKDSLKVPIGGTKPQNAGSLAYGGLPMLSNLPPSWEGSNLPYGENNFFKKWASQKSTRKLWQNLNAFLKSDPKPTRETRDRRDALMNAILKDLMGYRVFCRESPGWTESPSCRLPEDQKAWLDPTLPAQSSEGIIDAFGMVADRNLPDIPHGVSERNHWRGLFASKIRLENLT